MAKLSLVAGTTSKSVKIFVQNSSVTDGSGLTGLAFGTASLSAYYIREGAASPVAITLVTATLGTWTSSGFIVVDGTNLPGLYELDLPNAVLAAGAKSVVIYLFGAANMVPTVLEIELTAVNNQDSVRYGMTALPNAAAGAATGIPLLTTPVGSSPWDTTLLSDVLKAIWSQSIGKWVVSGTTLTLYAPDGTTVVKAFTLNSASSPTSRT